MTRAGPSLLYSPDTLLHGYSLTLGFLRPMGKTDSCHGGSSRLEVPGRYELIPGP